MRLYGIIEKVEAQSDGTVRVHGIATSEAVDEQGEIVRGDAMRSAMPEYMRFPALREMHQLSAAGTTLEAEVCEDGTTRIVAHVVDPVAVAKVKNQVYRGFSIGGRVIKRDATNPKIITGLVLNEISLVDRPANPEAVFDCWKAVDEGGRAGKAPGVSIRQPAAAVRGAFNAPLQIWACGVPDHRHLVKAEAVNCIAKGETGSAEFQSADLRTTALVTSHPSDAAPANRKPSAEGYDGDVVYADPGYQADGKKRYPIDTDDHIRAAWAYINKPGNAGQYTSDQLRRIRAAIVAAWKAKINKDGPPSASDSDKASRPVLLKMLWDVCRLARVIVDLDWLKDTLDIQAAMENDVAEQSLRLWEMIAELRIFLNGLLIAETGQLFGNTDDDDCDDDDGATLAPAMRQMLAMTIGVSGVRQAVALFEKGNPKMRKLAEDLLSKVKPSKSDQALMNIAHGCLSELTGGMLCTPITKNGAQPSTKKIQHLEAAHRHMVAAGANCASRASGSDAPSGDAASDPELMIGERGYAPGVTKLTAGESDEKAALVKVLGDIMPMLEQLTRRVEEIASTPLPPLTMAKNTASVSKREDSGGGLDSGDSELSSDAIAAALAKLSKEEQTLALIKASYAKPIRVPGAVAGEG